LKEAKASSLQRTVRKINQKGHKIFTLQLSLHRHRRRRRPLPPPLPPPPLPLCLQLLQDPCDKKSVYVKRSKYFQRLTDML
jgi:hypothetical protein